MLEDTEMADYSNPPKRKTRGRHTKTLRNCFFPLQGIQTDSLSVNWEGHSRRKLPFIFAYNHLAADKQLAVYTKERTKSKTNTILKTRMEKWQSQRMVRKVWITIIALVL